MALELEKIDNPHLLSLIISFIQGLDKFSSKNEIAGGLIDTLSNLFKPKFSSFVEKENSSLKVICQSGESNSIKNTFTKEMAYQIFDWVMSQDQIASLRVSDKEQFIFIPLVDKSTKYILEHGMLVFYLPDTLFEIKKELRMSLNVFSKLASQSMTKINKQADIENYQKAQDEIKSELMLATKIQKSISGYDTSKKILFSVLEDHGEGFSGNFWWLSNLSDDMTLVLVAQVRSYEPFSLNNKSIPLAMLNGFLISEMNSLKLKGDILLRPQDVLASLNHRLNPIFKNTGISVDAWYGVFNTEDRKIRFASANHSDPFLIGPEKQVTNLIPNVKGRSLGINLDSKFQEANAYIANGSKLIICTSDLLEQAAKIGEKYDPGWLPQVLETLGPLPLSEMNTSLRSILSEHSNGTGLKPSRLAILLEIPS